MPRELYACTGIGARDRSTWSAGEDSCGAECQHLKCSQTCNKIFAKLLSAQTAGHPEHFAPIEVTSGHSSKKRLLSPFDTQGIKNTIETQEILKSDLP